MPSGCVSVSSYLLLEAPALAEIFVRFVQWEVARQRIIFQGRELLDHDLIAQCGLDDTNPSVHLVMRLPAPGCGRRRKEDSSRSKNSSPVKAEYSHDEGITIKEEPVDSMSDEQGDISESRLDLEDVLGDCRCGVPKKEVFFFLLACSCESVDAEKGVWIGCSCPCVQGCVHTPLFFFVASLVKTWTAFSCPLCAYWVTFIPHANHFGLCTCEDVHVQHEPVHILICWRHSLTHCLETAFPWISRLPGSSCRS